jgi:hypothetical protein
MYILGIDFSFCWYEVKGSVIIKKKSETVENAETPLLA